VIISARVRPGAGRNEIEKIFDSEYLVFVKARAEDGVANLAVRKLLAREFGVGLSDVKIKTPKSRKKIVEIVGK